MKTMLAIILTMTFSGVAAAQTPAWTSEQKTDPLRGTSFMQFTLLGKFLTAPRGPGAAPNPLMVVKCSPGRNRFGHTNGKFMDGYIVIGSVLNTEVDSGGNVNVPVQFRLDDGKLQNDAWSHSTDYSAVFFGHLGGVVNTAPDVFNNLLYGHILPHKENTNPQVRKIVIGLDEYLGGEVVLQFDLPDSTNVADSCGVIWHK